jgi:hypothetical protein
LVLGFFLDVHLSPQFIVSALVRIKNMLSNNYLSLGFEVLVCAKIVLGKGNEGLGNPLFEQRASHRHSGIAEGDNVFHLHNHIHDQAPLLTCHEQHEQFYEGTEICPTVPTSPTPWNAGHQKPWAKVPLCTYSPDSYNSSILLPSPDIATSADTKEPLCIFTDSNFYSDRGISILTRPSIAKEISTSPAFNPSPEGYESEDKNGASIPPPYEIQYVPGKGMGVIANRTIVRGERLFAHPVIAIYHNHAFMTRRAKEYELREGMMEKGIEWLPEESRRQFWAMIGQVEKEGGGGAVGRLNVNTFGEEFGGEEHSIVIPETAVSFLLSLQHLSVQRESADICAAGRE